MDAASRRPLVPDIVITAQASTHSLPVQLWRPCACAYVAYDPRRGGAGMPAAPRLTKCYIILLIWRKIIQPGIYLGLYM